MSPHRTINNHLNSVFDDTDDFLSCELKSILNHRYLTRVLEFKLEYDNGEISWYPLDLVKDEDPHVCAIYIVCNDLSPIYNGVHRYCACAFLRSLKITMCLLKHIAYLDFYATLYNLPSRKRRSSCYAKNVKTLVLFLMKQQRIIVRSI